MKEISGTPSLVAYDGHKYKWREVNVDSNKYEIYKLGKGLNMTCSDRFFCEILHYHVYQDKWAISFLINSCRHVEIIEGKHTLKEVKKIAFDFMKETVDKINKGSYIVDAQYRS